MKTIYKYMIEPKEEQQFEIPLINSNLIHDFKDQFLKVDVINGTPYMWVMVDDNNRKVTRTIHVKGTGFDCSNVDIADYLGSFILYLDGKLVLHIFGH